MTKEIWEYDKKQSKRSDKRISGMECLSVGSETWFASSNCLQLGVEQDAAFRGECAQDMQIVELQIWRYLSRIQRTFYSLSIIFFSWRMNETPSHKELPKSREFFFFASFLSGSKFLRRI